MKISELKRKLVVLLTIFSVVFSFAQTDCELRWSRFTKDIDTTTDIGKALVTAIDENPETITSWWVFDTVGEDALRTNLEELSFVTTHLKAKNKTAEVIVDEIKNAGSYVEWKSLTTSEVGVLDEIDIAKLRANEAAHTIERHGFEVTDDLLKRRATEGIAPDGSSIAKRQGGRRIGNIIPPMSSKFIDAISMKKALNAVDVSTSAFKEALKAEKLAKGTDTPPLFKFQVDLGETIGLGYKKPIGTPNYVLTGQKLSGNPIKINGLTKIEVRYKLNRATGKYEINTMFPIE
ncbi:hypothetical protein NH341_05660 [Tenacibaculum sp. XPcli2-G]|uniref:hypothetical protein n=1 Tax=Tenacibaculum sp. XPcli2-G TaxID=2954503 RepID=UPI002096DC92|nr:hypothetical protein [Tenacibaculum sp. XPcli2-G]MCO7184902.1 hypothetical protein [Tenacibaculum sp. XPcli2-G]